MTQPWNILFSIKEAYSLCLCSVGKQYGLNLMEVSILLLLAGNPELNTAQKIVNFCYLSKSHVSTSLHTLELKGLIRRLTEGQKRKNVHLQIMESGLEIANDAKKALGELEMYMENDLSEQQILMLQNSIDTIQLNLQQFIQKKYEESDLL